MLQRHLSARTMASHFAFAALTALTITARFASAEDLDLERFEKSTICGDLVQPMELDLAPDGRIFLIELSGKLKVIDPTNGKQDVVGEIKVTTAQENGLIGLALDPNFATNAWIYLQYSPPDFSGQRISRFEFRDGKLDLTSEKVLFTYEEQRRECCHHAGSLEFGPDGNLYIGTGDNTNPFNDSQGYAPLDQRADRGPWDAQRTAGNTKSYNGKVLRIRPEPDGTYSIPDGNLFPKDGSIGHPEIYVMGCRNPWRISLDQRSGFLYWGDVGPDAGGNNDRGPRGYDEVNQARAAGNFGWPYFIGNNFAYSMIDFETGKIGPPQDPSQPINESINNTGSRQLPPAQPAMIYYPSATSPDFPEVGSGGRTACAGPVYYFNPQLDSTTKFPAQYDRTLFAFEWSRNAIYAVHLDDDHHLQRIERFLPKLSFIRPIDLIFSNQGALYVIEYGETWGVNPDAKLVRVDYVRGNRKPTAIAKTQGEIGREPLTVELTASESIDRDNDPLTFRWTAVRTVNEKQERMVLGNEAVIKTTFNDPSVYTIELQVTDTHGATDLTTLPVIVGNARPIVEFVKPFSGDFFTPGQPLKFSLIVRDQEDGTSDEDQAEEPGWKFIDSTAPSRLYTEAIPVTNEATNTAEAAPGLQLIRKSDCLNCHAINRALVGPSFVEVANKYRDQPHQLEVSVKRVQEGSTGVWGKVGMLPHQQHTAAEVRSMVEYVFSLTAAATNPNAPGFNNELVAPENSQTIRLEATYTDLGRDGIPKLTGTGTVQLRSRRQQAEQADHFAGTQKLGSGKAEGKAFMGAIEHDGYLLYRNVNFDSIKSIIVRVTSAGVGGEIEIHRGTVDGPMLGKVAVEVNGSWEDFHDKTVELDPTTGRDDLYVVFKNSQRRGGLMNIDAIEFR